MRRPRAWTASAPHTRGRPDAAARRDFAGQRNRRVRKRVLQRLSRDEGKRLIQQAYKSKGAHGLLIKTHFQTGARVSEFASIRVEDLFFEELMILIKKGKGKRRYVPPLAELAQELRTHLGVRQVICLKRTDTCRTLRDASSRSSKRRQRKHRSRSASIRIC